MTNSKGSNLRWLWWLVGLSVLLIVALPLMFAKQIYVSTPEVRQASLPEAPRQPSNINTVTICTDFEYSDWSSCSEDGQQYRAIKKMLPAGCTGGNPIQSQKCQYIPITESAPEMLSRMIKQIRNAPNQTIDSSYVSGTNGELMQKLSYRILDNSLVIVSTLIHRDTNVAEPTIDFIDTNLDGFVDYWAGADRIPHPLDKQSEEYAQIQTNWGIYLINFANHHLTK